MKTALATILLASACCAAAQQLDFSSLERLGSKAKSVNKVSLSREQLQSALSMLSGAVSESDKEGRANVERLNRLTKDLTGVEVRSFEFDKKGQYKDSDLAEIRDQMTKLKSWSKIIDSKEDGEHSEIFMSSVEGNKGLMIISAEETELSVVMLKGSNSLEQLGSLGGIMGLPSMAVGPAKKKE